jgi:hypothetical protein
VNWPRVLAILGLVVAAIGLLVFSAQRLKADGAAAANEKAAQAVVATQKEDAAIGERRVQNLSEIAHDATVQSDSSRAAAARAADALAAERLRLDAYVRNARAAHPAPAGASAPADDPIGVFAALQRRFDEAAGRYAAEADANRIAGLACERAYDSLMP